MLFPSLPGEGKESVWGQWGLAVTFEMLDRCIKDSEWEKEK